MKFPLSSENNTYCMIKKHSDVVHDKVMVDSAVSSFSSSSSVEEDDQRRSRKRRRNDHKVHRSDNKHERHAKNNFEQTASLQLQPCIAAPSDWDELRKHYQFVLPTDDDSHDNTTNNNTQKTWQQRMVQNYHKHLYKEYVLADLSRVLDIGKIGLRWRTEKEVADGKGFRCCGNLMCNLSSKTEDGDKEAYAAAVKRHMGIAVPENGGKEPLGVLLPTSTIGQDDMNTLDAYLQSCAQERNIIEHRLQDGDDKKHSHRHKHKSKRKRKHKHHKRRYKEEDDDDTTAQYTSLKEQEQREQRRLSALPYGIGLHDYEVDFVYIQRFEHPALSEVVGSEVSVS